MPLLRGLQYYNDKMISMAEHWDEFIMARSLANPNIWHDRIPRGAYKLYSGMEQKSNIFRGGLLKQAGLDTWQEMGTSNKTTGYDNCNPGTPQRYNIAWETVSYKGYQDHWQSDPLCVNDLKFQDYAREQVALNVRVGVDYGISMLENWNREQYVLQALLSNRGMIMASGALEFQDNATYRFDYDPFSTTTDVDGDSVPFITYDPTVELSTLNWDFIDYLRFDLSQRAGEAALGMESGMPVFGLMIDFLDFERMVKEDEELRKDWREAKPQTLIDGYNMGVTMYRGMGIMHDARQMRFRIKGIESGNMVATRVLPQRAGRAVTIGNIPEPNPEYYRAELAIGVVFMNDVLTNLFVPSVDSLGSGTSFGPMPGLTGQWKWINIQDNTENILGESGFFYGRFQIFPKPMLFAHECTVFLYRRCVQGLRSKCAIESHDDVGAGAIGLAADAAAGDFSEDPNQFTLTLTALLGAGIGDEVTVTKADTNTFTAQIISDSLAPQYTFAWVDGIADEPTGISDFTVVGNSTVEVA